MAQNKKLIERVFELLRLFTHECNANSENPAMKSYISFIKEGADKIPFSEAFASQTVGIHKLILTLITNLSDDPNCEIILNYDFIPLLMECARRKVNEICFPAIRTLVNLSSVRRCKLELFGYNDFYSFLFEKLQNERKNVKIEILKILVELSQDQEFLLECQRKIVEAGMLPLVIDLMNDNDDDIVFNATETITNFTADSQFNEQIVTYGSIPFACKNVSSSNHYIVQAT